MFESGTYKSIHEHIALYEALEASMAQAQRDEFLAEKDKSRKRCRDDQDPPPPPPPPDSNLSKSSFKQQSGPYDEQPVEDMPISVSTNISDLEDTGSAHLSHVKPRPEWLKPIPEDDRPATPEPAWVIPTSHIPDAENNWANALATTKGSGQALSISKMKDARYHDFGLELLVPEHMWIDDVCIYDISASYGISHWWFNRQKFYID
ncbi:hypothetical protein Tco_1181800 [Tanacetum coccineum]